MVEDTLYDFALDESVKKEITNIFDAVIVASDIAKKEMQEKRRRFLAAVEDAILVYHIKKRFYDGRPSIPKLNETFNDVRMHISALTEILSDALPRDYLLGIAEEYYPDAGGKQFLAMKAPPFVNRTPRLQILDALEKLDKVCEASITKQKSGPGKSKGQKDEAVHIFLNKLYRCCEFANGGPLTTKPGNMLACLVKVLNKPLGLGGDLPGVVRKTIEKNTKEGSKLGGNE